MPECNNFSNALARWLMACFFRRIDLRESLLHAVGDENGIIAEAVIAARRETQMPVHFAFKHLRFTGRQGRCIGAQTNLAGLVERFLLPKLVMDAGHGDAENPWSAPPNAPNKFPARPSSAATHRPESSARAAWRLALAEASALIRALAAKVAPVFLPASGRPSVPALTASMPCGPSSALISRTLPLLCEGDHQLAAARQSHAHFLMI